MRTKRWMDGRAAGLERKLGCAPEDERIKPKETDEEVSAFAVKGGENAGTTTPSSAAAARPQDASRPNGTEPAETFGEPFPPEGAAGGGAEPCLELLCLPDDRNGLRAGRVGERRVSPLRLTLSAAAFRLTPESFAGRADDGPLDFRSWPGRMRRKAVAADRVHRLRFDAQALVGCFADGPFREAWRASKETFGAPRFIASLFLEGEFVPAAQSRDEAGRTVLSPDVLGEDGRIFRDAVGLVELALRFAVTDPRTGEKAVLTLFAEPVAAALPDGPAARRIGTMADVVLSGWEKWLAPRGVTAKLRTGADRDGRAEDRTATGSPASGTSPEAGGGSLEGDGEEERGERPETTAKDRTVRKAGELVGLADESVPRDRLEALDRILRVYETGLPYFRANPRMKLRREQRIDGAEKLRDFSHAAAAYMATHPEHLTEAPAGRGIRVGMRRFLPKKVLVESEEKSADTYENRVVVGFLKTLHAEVEEECRRLREALSNISLSSSSTMPEPDARDRDEDGAEDAREGTVNPAGAGGLARYTATDEALFSDAVRRMERSLAALTGRADRIRVLYRHYRDAMPVTEIVVTGTCPPTPVFLSLPAYRMVYEAIRDWTRSEWTREEGASGLLSFLRQSRLYECWALTGLLEAFGREGFRLVRKRRHAYEPPYSAWEQTDFFNTFRFVREEGDRTAEATLFYEPVVRPASALYDRPGAPLFENGVKFVRTTVFTPEEGAEGAGLKCAGPGSPLFFTPDFLLRIRVQERGETASEGRSALTKTFWVVADAKYSTAERVAQVRAMPAAFKYLFGMKPLEEKDRVLGLWLFCGRPSDPSRSSSSEALNAMGAGTGMTVGPDVHVVEMVPEEKSGEKTAGGDVTPWAKWLRSVLERV